jgi:hypothetical protein
MPVNDVHGVKGETAVRAGLVFVGASDLLVGGLYTWRSRKVIRTAALPRATLPEHANEMFTYSGTSELVKFE